MSWAKLGVLKACKLAAILKPHLFAPKPVFLLCICKENETKKGQPRDQLIQAEVAFSYMHRDFHITFWKVMVYVNRSALCEFGRALL